MNRIIFERAHPSNTYLYQLAKVYDYEHNPDGYACIDVDDETLLYLTLRHVTWKHTFAPGRYNASHNAQPMSAITNNQNEILRSNKYTSRRSKQVSPKHRHHFHGPTLSLQFVWLFRTIH